MPKPLVSIIVPTKNSALTLRACLDSIQNQTFKEIEIIVVDNFSIDETPSIAREYTNLFFSQGPERSAQRNFGAAKAQGQYLLFIDSDMKLDKQVVEECVHSFDQDKQVRSVVIPEESFGIGFWAQCKKLERSFYLGIDWMEAVRFFQKKDFLHVGGYNSNLVSGEDWDISNRISALGKKSRVSAYIFHDEGKLRLLTTLRKKFFYATKFSAYMDEVIHQPYQKKQTGIITRYRLFFSHPKKLFRSPLLGIGMLFMKTAEFIFGGVGYLVGKYNFRKMV